MDIYGKSKSLGEVHHESFYNIRCSIIGNELYSKKSLFEWFRNDKSNVLNGYVNHFWNGVTTKTFAKIIKAIILNNFEIPNSINLVPKNIVTKYELLNLFNRKLNLKKRINPVDAPSYCNRALKTNYPDLNISLWKLAGYNEPLTVEEMIENEIDF